MKKTLSYLLLCICYAVIGLGMLAFGSKPWLEFMDAKLVMSIVKGEPKTMEPYETEQEQVSEPVKENKKMSQTGKNVKPAYGTLYGTILCEEIELNVPLYFGDDEELLKKGAGQYIESAMPGTDGTIIIGGHDSTYFAPLERIQEGNLIQIQMEHEVIQYQVEKIKIADAEDRTAYDLKESRENLILYTCYPFGEVNGKRSDRYYVYCSPIQ